MEYKALKEYERILSNSGILAYSKIDFISKTPIKKITYDSREIIESSLFICKGVHFQTKFLEAAISGGAVCYVSEVEYALDNDFPCMIVTNMRLALSLIADYYYDSIWKKLHIIGVTGTKGKSTTTYYIKSILDDWMAAIEGELTAVLSGIDVYDGVITEESHLTTPETFELYRHFYNAVSKNINYLSMEVSSQALKYDRTKNIIFDAACFLNIDEDHISLYEHSDYEDYIISKLRIFSQCEYACVNLGSADIDRVLAAAKASPNLVTFGLSPEANVYAYDIQKQSIGLSFKVKTRGTKSIFTDELFEISMPGFFNIENALCAISASICLDVPTKYIKSGLKRALVAGRMEVYTAEGKLVIVDYAHNRLSFETLFKSVKKEYPGKKISIVFGCPGKKALGRRRELGTLSGEYADLILLTEEDAGEESVLDICREIELYVNKAEDVLTIPDREEAIEKAIEVADEGWVVLVTGKGRETRHKRGLEYIDTPSDVEIVCRCLGLPDSR
jgi:UDP-N-acetylmuramoyl-L-alanyl-D-glutamate--2,6-diaminopimelate ligase